MTKGDRLPMRHRKTLVGFHCTWTPSIKIAGIWDGVFINRHQISYRATRITVIRHFSSTALLSLKFIPWIDGMNPVICLDLLTHHHRSNVDQKNKPSSIHSSSLKTGVVDDGKFLVHHEFRGSTLNSSPLC